MIKYSLAAGLTALAVATATAAPTGVNGYAVDPVFTTPSATSASIVDFTAADGDIYYMTRTSGYQFDGLWSVNSGNVVAGTTDYSGASVVADGNYVYYNDSNYPTASIYGYGSIADPPGSRSVSGTAMANYTFTSDGGGTLFIAAADVGSPNEIYWAPVNGDGSVGTATSIGTQPGSSGPLAFDSHGNLFYAPGSDYTSGNLDIYMWTALQVAEAMAGTTPLSAASVWLEDFDVLYPDYSGASAMAFDDEGNLLITLTDFVNGSSLVTFGVDQEDPLFSYDGTTEQLLTDTERMGAVRNINGQILVASGNSLYEVVPEPTTGAMLLLSLGALGFARKRSRG